jgi:hypothetical protein
VIPTCRPLWRKYVVLVIVFIILVAGLCQTFKYYCEEKLTIVFKDQCVHEIAVMLSIYRGKTSVAFVREECLRFADSRQIEYRHKLFATFHEDRRLIAELAVEKQRLLG